MLARSQPLPATRALQGRQWLRASPAVTRPQPRLSASASRRYVAPSAALQGAEVFVHPRYGRAVRATERLPAGAVVLKERPFFTTRTSAKAAAEAAKVRIVRSQSPRGRAPHAFVRIRNGGLRCAVTKLRACVSTPGAGIDAAARDCRPRRRCSASRACLRVSSPSAPPPRTCALASCRCTTAAGLRRGPKHRLTLTCTRACPRGADTRVRARDVRRADRSPRAATRTSIRQTTLRRSRSRLPLGW